jgi:hypothetical protein
MQPSSMNFPPMMTTAFLWELIATNSDSVLKSALENAPQANNSVLREVGCTLNQTGRMFGINRSRYREHRATGIFVQMIENPFSERYMDNNR